MPGWWGWASKRDREVAVGALRGNLAWQAVETEEIEGFQRLRGQWSRLLVSTQIEDWKLSFIFHNPYITGNFIESCLCGKVG